MFAHSTCITVCLKVTFVWGRAHINRQPAALHNAAYLLYLMRASIFVYLQVNGKTSNMQTMPITLSGSSHSDLCEHPTLKSETSSPPPSPPANNNIPHTNGVGDSNRHQEPRRRIHRGSGDSTCRPRTAEKITPKDFRFGKRIGEGSFSTVYLAEDVHLQKEFASKCIEENNF